MKTSKLLESFYRNNEIYGKNKSITSVLKYFYTQLYREYQPDITGYSLVFMVPPDLSGYGLDQNSGFLKEVSKFFTFAAIDFTPPASQVNTEKITARTGAIPFAIEVQETEQVSITYIENKSLDVYRFHHIWREYIRQVTEGMIRPSNEYLDSGRIDYAASAFVVKFNMTFDSIDQVDESKFGEIFIGKCTGIFPQSLPNKELIGQRTGNELTTLPITYFCANYREALYGEKSFVIEHFKTLISSF